MGKELRALHSEVDRFNATLADAGQLHATAADSAAAASRDTLTVLETCDTAFMAQQTQLNALTESIAAANTRVEHAQQEAAHWQSRLAHQAEQVTGSQSAIDGTAALKVHVSKLQQQLGAVCSRREGLAQQLSKGIAAWEAAATRARALQSGERAKMAVKWVERVTQQLERSIDGVQREVAGCTCEGAELRREMDAAQRAVAASVETQQQLEVQRQELEERLAGLEAQRRRAVVDTVAQQRKHRPPTLHGL